MKKIINLCSLLLIIANVIVALVFYFTTDMIAIPAHWSTFGEMNSYGKTWLILVLAALSILIYLLMIWSERHHAVNLPFKVKDELAALPIIDDMLSWTNMLVMALLLYVVLAVAQYVPMFMAVVYAFLLIIVIVDLRYITLIYKCGR